MSLNTYPYNPFPASTDKLDEIDTIKSGLTNLDNEVNGDATVYPYADVITVEDDVPANLAGCMVKIEPVQSGTGTPSSTNVRPITGHTEASVEVSAPNRYVEGTASIKVAGNWDNDNTESAKTSSDYTVDGNTLSGTSSGYRWMHIPYSFEADKTVYLRWNNTLVSFRVSGSNGAKKADSSGGTYTPSESFNGFIDRPLNPQTINNMKFGIGYTNDFDIDTYNKKPIQTYTIALGDTIYGGTVDFDSGVMTVDREYFKITDDTHITRNTGSYPTNSFRTTGLDLGLNNGNVISDRYTEGSDVGQVRIASNGALVITTTAEYASIQDALSGELDNSEFVYELATPTTIQLTPQQIQLLKGTNTLYASTGQISVTVNGVSGAIGAMQTAVNELAEQLPDAPTTDGAYVLTVTVADGAATYSWESAE